MKGHEIYKCGKLLSAWRY